MIRSQRRARARAAAVLGAVLSLAATSCGGVTKFSDTTPIDVKGPALEPPPAPPPPPPPPKPKRVEVKQDRIEINEKIQFEVNQAIIRPESHGLLDEVVGALKEHASIKKVEIGGHTSDEGADKYNQTLSDKRARAVLDYLTAHGIDQARLVSKGFGESKPIADNTTEEGREKNRRVEFLILEQDGASAKSAGDDKDEKKEKADKKNAKKDEKADEKAEKAEKKEAKKSEASGEKKDKDKGKDKDKADNKAQGGEK